MCAALHSASITHDLLLHLLSQTQSVVAFLTKLAQWYASLAGTCAVYVRLLTLSITAMCSQIHLHTGVSNISYLPVSQTACGALWCCRVKFLWRDALIVTDPVALGAIMGRGEGAIDKAAAVYATINKMCDPHGHPNLLTSAANEEWKAIRKAVSVSFSIHKIKQKFPLVRQRIQKLVERLKVLGPKASVDVDQAALRVTLDVIGLVS